MKCSSSAPTRVNWQEGHKKDELHIYKIHNGVPQSRKKSNLAASIARENQ